MESYSKQWRAQIRGGKEKLGCFVLQVSYDHDERGSSSEVERLREEMRLRSLSICEVCGKQGRLRLAGYAKTVCDAHAVELVAMRDDDGQYADPWTWAGPDDGPSKSEITVMGTGPMQAFYADVPELQAEADTLNYRSRELLQEYAGYFVDAAKGSVVKEEYLPDYVRGEVAGWPDVLLLPPKDHEWLRAWLMKMIEAEYERVRRKQEHP